MFNFEYITERFAILQKMQDDIDKSTPDPSKRLGLIAIVEKECKDILEVCESEQKIYTRAVISRFNENLKKEKK